MKKFTLNDYECLHQMLLITKINADPADWQLLNEIDDKIIHQIVEMRAEIRERQRIIKADDEEDNKFRKEITR